MPIKVITENDKQKEVCVLSYSSYSTYKQCPKRYYREKVVKEPLEKVDETFTIPGRIVHDSAHHYFTTGSLEKFDLDYLRSELEKMGELPTVNYDKAYGSFDKAFTLLQKSAKSLQSFVVTRDPQKQFISEGWFGDWDSPLFISDNLALQGAADLIEINPNGTALLYDYKTSWNTNNLSRDQLILYAIAAKLKWNINITMGSFFLLPSNKQNFYNISAIEKEDLLTRLQKTANEILSKKEKMPVSKNNKCKYCPFYDTCEAMEMDVFVNNLPEGEVSFDFNAEL